MKHTFKGNNKYSNDSLQSRVNLSISSLKNIYKIKQAKKLLRQKYDEATLKQNESQMFYFMASDNILNLINNPNASYDGIMDYIEFCEGWDKDGEPFPLALANTINQIINDPSLIFFTHNIAYKKPMPFDSSNIHNAQLLKDIFNNGIRNNGYQMQGRKNGEYLPISSTVGCQDSFLAAIIYLRRCPGCVIGAIPSDFVDITGSIAEGHELDVYNEVNDFLYIKPEFLLGYTDSRLENVTFFDKDMFISNDLKL